jgi:AcrR family transcriptional regulator
MASTPTAEAGPREPGNAGTSQRASSNAEALPREPRSAEPRSAEASLRERKKQRTREALSSAAFDLFDRKGFEATTVDEIADRVEISSRTFFRYFSSKDEVVLASLDEQYTLVFAAFDLRPPDEPVLTALRRAAMEVLRTYESGQDAERLATVVRLVCTSPALAASSAELCNNRTNELVERVARRMGVSPTDPRPALVAAVTMSAFQTATGVWRDNEPGTPSSVLVDRAFELLAAGINYPAA